VAVTILLKLSWSTAENIFFNNFYGSHCPMSVEVLVSQCWCYHRYPVPSSRKLLRYNSTHNHMRVLNIPVLTQGQSSTWRHNMTLVTCTESPAGPVQFLQLLLLLLVVVVVVVVVVVIARSSSSHSRSSGSGSSSSSSIFSTSNMTMKRNETPVLIRRATAGC
jgi:uncharacterized membrane protein YgcG